MATDIVVSVVAEIVNKLVGGAIHQVHYLFCFNNYVKDLETEKDTLQSKLESVLDRSKEAKKKTEKIDRAVEQWLKDADCLVTKVVELEEKAEKRKKTSCLTHCPNWFRRYRLAKQLEEKTNEIKKHNQIEFSQFSRLETLIGMKYFSSEGFIPFNSRKLVYDELLEALQDDEVFKIGLWGMGGCGKTTLVKEVSKEAEQFFDRVVFVVVSNPINVRKIQGNIADQLNISLTEEEEPERARRLFMRLSKGERVLIILDDVWEKLDFEVIGIPTGENQKACHALLTTRKHNVCTLMDCQRIIPLNLLSEEEAWTLFEKHAEITDNNSDTLKSLAREITNECKGLPVAIAAVASTLKGKTRVEWEEVLKTLRNSRPMDIEEGLKNPYTCLQLSYDYLKNEAAKSLFLLCSVFPEDYEILVEDLTIFGIGLGLVKEAYSYNSTRNQVSIAINKLIDSCLLLKDDEEDYVKMHDLVRDVAMWIANKDNKLIMGTEMSQNALEEDGTIMDSTIRYLWCQEVENFPQKLDCPKLEFLFLSVNLEHCVEVPNDFFEGMKEIRVLVLKNEESYGNKPKLQLSQSVELLTNLHCLFLCGWELGNVSFIAGLKRLETLTLQDCSFHELPNGIIKLKNLRLLDLSDCKIQRNPYEVIGRCSQLKELCFNENICTEWEDQDGNVVEFFDKNKATLALQRYWIKLGKRFSHFSPFGYQQFSISRGVFVQYFDTCISNATIKDLMQRAEVLSLGGIRSCKSIFPDTVQTIGGLNELTKLSLHDSDEIECVIDATSCLCQADIISNLTQLIIEGMKGLKILCHGYFPRSLFEKLEVLQITECNALKHIIDEAEEIISNDNDATAYRVPFPRLKHLQISCCKQLEYLFPVSYAQSLTQLKILDISNAVELKYIFGQSNHEDKNLNKSKIIELPVLERLNLKKLPNIISICPEDYYPLCPSLKDLYVECLPLNIMSIIHCIGGSKLKQEDQIAPEDQMGAITKCIQNLKSLKVRNCSMDPIFHLEGLPINGQQVTFGLPDLTLRDLPELRYIWMGPNHFWRLQNLHRLTIVGCEKLKVIFSRSVFSSIPQLIRLEILDCKEVEKIIEDEAKEIILSDNNETSYGFAFPRLKYLIVRGCEQLEHLFPVSFVQSLAQLESLRISDAVKLKYVFGQSNHEDQDPNKFKIIELPILKVLHLEKLPNIISICPSHYYPLWPSLQHSYLENCPLLNTMSINQCIVDFELRRQDNTTAEDQIGAIVTRLQNLKSLYVENFKIDGIFHLEGLPMNGQQVTFGLQDLTLQDLPELRYIWMGSKHFLSLQNLRGLKIVKCGKLKVIFSTSILRSLPQLKTLVITNCKELEKIIEDDEENQSLSNPQVLFLPQLTTLIVKDCHKLKSLFSISTSHDLPKLIEASQLKEVFGNEQNERKESAENVLPKLKYLILMQLPRLAAVCHSIDLQSVRYCLVQESPNLSLTSTITLEDLLQKYLHDKDNRFGDNAYWMVRKVLNGLIRDSTKETTNNIPIEGASESELPSSQGNANQSMPHNLAINNQNDCGIQSDNEQRVKETKKEIPTMATSTNSDLIGMQVPSPLAIPMHKTPSPVTELVDERPISGPSLTDQQQPLWKTEITIEIAHGINSMIEIEDLRVQEGPKLEKTVAATMSTNLEPRNSSPRQLVIPLQKSVKGSVEEGSTSEKAKIVTSSTHSELASSLPGPLVISLHKKSQHSQMRGNKTETDTKTDPVNLGDFEDDDLISLFQSMEENDGQLPIPCVSIVPTQHPTTDNNLVAKALANLEVSLKMPLKDIATSYANSLCLLTSLNFLSRLSLEDGAVPNELKAIIKYLHQDLPSILCSFKQAFATINKFDALEERDKSIKEELAQRKEASITLVSEISQAKKFIDEAQEKEANLKNHISKLEKEIKDCEANLSSLQEQKKKYVAETMEFKKECETVRKEKFLMMEDQRKAKQELFQVDYRWSTLCSQFEQNTISARNLS